MVPQLILPIFICCYIHIGRFDNKTCQLSFYWNYQMKIKILLYYKDKLFSCKFHIYYKSFCKEMSAHLKRCSFIQISGRCMSCSLTLLSPYKPTINMQMLDSRTLLEWQINKEPHWKLLAWRRRINFFLISIRLCSQDPALLAQC